MSSVELGPRPSCPRCGWALGDVHRLEADSTRWECPHCRNIWQAHEVFVDV